MLAPFRESGEHFLQDPGSANYLQLLKINCFLVSELKLVFVFALFTRIISSTWQHRHKRFGAAATKSC